MLLALAGCEPSDLDVRAAEMPIVDGTRELGEPAVVVVAILGGAGLCTGTLITPNVVLTAKHCVQGANADAPYPPSVFTVGVGSDVRNTVPYRVSYVETTPGVYTTSATTGLGGAIVGIDVGVLVLRTPVTDVEPIPVRRDRPGDMVGQMFTAIGFGQTPTGGSGLKYKLTTGTLDSISGTVLYTAEVICSGDSGGPMIQETPERRVIGVASFGQAGACPSSLDGYNALFEQMPMIDRAIVVSGGCVDLGEELCDSIDNDCDGMIDEDCAALGESCAASTDCAFAQLPDYLTPLDGAVVCEDVGAGPVCTRTCDPIQPGLGCSEIAHFGRETVTPLDGYYCARTTGCEGRCARGEAGTLVDGSACTADTDCASLSCADPGDGSRHCLPVCRSGDANCPIGEACAAGLGQCSVCIDADRLVASRQIGEPCTGDSDCAAGTCQADPSGAYCTRACNADVDCPASLRCNASVCTRGARAEVGDPCAENGDCRAPAFCADQAGRRWCSRICNDATECPAGFGCVPAGGQMICAPTGQLLGESCAAAECSAGLCDGVCTRACGSASACPTGFACQRDDDGNARCLRPASGGCSATPGKSSMLVLLFALGMFSLRMRRVNRAVPRRASRCTTQR